MALVGVNDSLTRILDQNSKIIQGVPKQVDKSKVLKHIKKMHFLGCQFDKSDRKCWLFDDFIKIDEYSAILETMRYLGVIS